MKKILLLISGVLLTSLMLLSCSKTGPAGVAGKDGSNGINGINGKDGTTIYSGTGVPDASIGKVGDFYLDIESVMLYGPKTSSGWDTGVKLQGINGTDGINGTKIWSGDGSPLDKMGSIGDFYIDTTNVVIYGPKLSPTDWGNQISLRNDSTSIKTYVITAGFENIQLQSKIRAYQTDYHYGYDVVSQFVFNQDDADRRSKFKYFNYGVIPYAGIYNQIAARAMNVSIRQSDLIVDPRLRFAVVGQPFQFLADSASNSFIFTKEDSVRMASTDYPDPLIYKVLDPSMKVGENMRFGELKSKVDSLNSYQFIFADTNKIVVSKYISNFENIIQNGIVFVYLDILPEYDDPDRPQENTASQYGDQFMKSRQGMINDSTRFSVSLYKGNRDTMFVFSTMYTSNFQSGIVENGPVYPPLTGSLVRGGRTYGSRSLNYNAEEFRGKQFYKIKLLVIPPAEVINLSARGVDVHDKFAVKRALKL